MSKSIKCVICKKEIDTAVNGSWIEGAARQHKKGADFYYSEVNVRKIRMIVGLVGFLLCCMMFHRQLFVM